MYSIVPLFIILCLVTVSCENVQKGTPKPYRSDNDTVIRDIPEWYSNSGFTKRYNTKIFELLKLRSLENGHDNLNIRISTGCEQASRSIPSELIMLERTKSGWNAILYSFTVQPIGNGDEGTNYEFEIRDVRLENLSPKSGWKRFSEDLINSGILNLKDGSEFFNSTVPEVFRSFWVETGTPKKYRIYHFNETETNKSITDSGKSDSPIKLIQKEFNIMWPCKYD